MSDEKIIDNRKTIEAIKTCGLPVFIWGYVLTAKVVAETLKRAGITVAGCVTDKAGVQKDGVLSKDELIKNYPQYVLIRGFESLTWVSDEKIKSLWSGCKEVYTVPNPYDDIFCEVITKEYYLENKVLFDEVYDNLADDLSKKSLFAYIQAKVLQQQYPLLPVMISPQYFFKPSLWQQSSSDVLLDCGAFDGDSIFTFVNLYGDNYKQIVACEPAPSTFEKLQKNLQVHNIKNVVVLNFGVGEEKDTLRFNDESNVTSNFSDAGNLEVPVDTIDNIERLTGGALL